MNKYFVMIGLCSLGILNSHAAESLASIGLKMVRIPSGTFVMGSCLKRELTKLEIEENARRAFMGQLPAAQLKDPCLVGKLDPLGSVEETPQHKVTVRSFFMGETKVTLGQFKKFIEAKGRADLLTTTFMNYHNTYGDSAPVHGVSWTDAQAFINWLNQIEGGGFRLPSESEWEYACRAGENHIYCGGDKADDFAWYEGNSEGFRHDVATRKPNSFGLFDMSGNEWESMQDCWHANYIGAPNDGSAWVKDCLSPERKVNRGGSFHNPLKLIRAASRSHSLSELSLIGFRVARELR